MRSSRRRRCCRCIIGRSELPLDLVLAGPGLEQEFLEDRAVLVDVAGTAVPFISPEDLIATKTLRRPVEGYRGRPRHSRRTRAGVGHRSDRRDVADDRTGAGTQRSRARARSGVVTLARRPYSINDSLHAAARLAGFGLSLSRRPNSLLVKVARVSDEAQQRLVHHGVDLSRRHMKSSGHEREHHRLIIERHQVARQRTHVRHRTRLRPDAA